MPDHGGKHNQNGVDTVDVEKREIRDGGQDTSMDGPSERDAREHGGEEKRESILIPFVVHHEREEDAERDHERGHQTVDDKVTGLARDATLHGDGRVAADVLELVHVEVGHLRDVVLDRVHFDVHVVVQLPDMFVETGGLGHFGRDGHVLHKEDLFIRAMRRHREGEI